MIETLQPIIILLACGIASVMILPRLGISPIVGFLLAGLVLGHHGLGLIAHNETTHLLAELGVVFLLFDIGLHLSLRHVWQERKGIFVIGPLQMLITAGLFYLIGLNLGLPQTLNILLSFTLALSSTAVVSQVLADKNLQNCPNSSTAIAVLIFQDICAIFLLILADTMASGSDSLGSELGMAVLKCGLSFVAALLIGKYVLKPVFKQVIASNNSEVFTMIALFLVLITGMATGAVGLSLTLGAFLAGMIISETPFKHVIQTELRPFRFLLLSFFFLTVGTNIDFHVLFNDWSLVLLATAVIMAVKMAAILLLFFAMREKFVNGIQQATLLFQGSEFLFVIIATPAVSQLIDPKLANILVAAVAITMALTSFVFGFGWNWAKKMIETELTDDEEEEDVESQPVMVVVGMNRTGLTLSHAMQAFNIPYLAVERDYELFLQARTRGFPVIFGDKADLRFWENLGLNQFKFIAIADPTLELSRYYAPIAKTRFPNVVRYAALHSEKDIKEYEEMNYRPIVSAGVPHGLELAEKILSDLGISTEEIMQWVEHEQNQYLSQQKGDVERQAA